MKIIVDMPKKELGQAVLDKIKKDNVERQIEQLTDIELSTLRDCIGELFESLDLDQEVAVELIKDEINRRLRKQCSQSSESEI